MKPKLPPLPHEFRHASASFKRLNPGLFGVGKVEAQKPEPTSARALDGGITQRACGTSRVAVRVYLIAHRRRLLDDDNNTASLKPLRDAIASSLGVDDADPRVSWDYAQVITRGVEGVTVTMEVQP